MERTQECTWGANAGGCTVVLTPINACLSVLILAGDSPKARTILLFFGNLPTYF